MPNFISEDDIERAILGKLKTEFGYEILDCNTVDRDDLNDGSGRTDKRDVIFIDRLHDSLERLNPDIPAHAIEIALERLTDKRRAMSQVSANREIDDLIRNGVSVTFTDDDEIVQNEIIRVIDFDYPGRNRFLAVTQLWIKGERHYRRPDILLYINGIPLVFIELKNSNVALRNAYEDNLTNYKAEIPQLFLTNAFCLLSNAIETKVGSMTASWEHFFAWLRITDEKEKIDRKAIQRDGTSVELAIAGLCEPRRLLDYVENYVIYYKEQAKIIAQNHQFIGVNNAFDSFRNREAKDGKLGVFWHTQGSGKSFSMIFLVRKIFRKLAGNFTFVVVTDRDDLDGQIYRNFLHTSTVTKAEAAQPKNSSQLRDFLGQNKRLVFTLIHKFRYDAGLTYPELSDRDDIIVMVDEAHRTQYKSLAENMRKGLPNANFIAFTGTPLLGKERKTNAWFGDYISEYNFQQSMDDGATVPLFYNKRVPEMANQNDDLSEEFYELLEEADLDEQGQIKLERKFAKEIEIIKRDDRLEAIAADIAYHFPRRGYLGKGIVVSLDKFTAVRMCDKVQRHWKAEIKRLKGEINKSDSEIIKARLSKIVNYMRSVEMAVVISEDNGEEEKFQNHGLDIKPYRQRIDALDANGHDIEYNFKDADHPLQLVFVCAMWLTGFDAPTVSTLYLDKPMKDHTLMQTIARANRVTSHTIDGISKRNGEIVDYYNVFRNLKIALKDYALGENDESPVIDKSELFEQLKESVDHGFSFCLENGVDLESVLDDKDTFKNIKSFKSFADTILGSEELRKSFNVYENTITSLYEAAKPEILGGTVVRTVAAFQYLRGIIDSIIEQQDIDTISRKISELLDESVVVEDADEFKRSATEPVFQIKQKGRTWDLSTVDFDKLKEEFKEKEYKNLEIADIKGFLERKIEQMLSENVTRRDFAEKLQEIINRYNTGGSSTENYYQELVDHTEMLSVEATRAVREGLTDDELEIFDLLKKSKLTKTEEQRVKLAAKALLRRLKSEPPPVLIQNWHMDVRSTKRVRRVVEEILDKELPESYDTALFREKCDHLLDSMVEYAHQGRKWLGEPTTN